MARTFFFEVYMNEKKIVLLTPYEWADKYHLKKAVPYYRVRMGLVDYIKIRECIRIVDYEN